MSCTRNPLFDAGLDSCTSVTYIPCIKKIMINHCILRKACVSTYVVCISLGALMKILINASTYFETTSHGIAINLFVKCYWNLKMYTSSKKKIRTFLLFLYKLKNMKLTLKHSIAVPAWCWNAIFAHIFEKVFLQLQPEILWENYFILIYKCD